MFPVQTFFIALPILLSFILNLASCLPLENTENGILANSTQFPYQLALLEINGKTVKQKCGAVLIEPDVALTAAHCFINPNKTVKEKRYAVVAGSDWLENRPQRIDVAEVYIHSGSIENLKTDLIYDNIAVLKLVQKFTLNAFINTIPLAKKDDKNLTADGVLSGYGWNEVPETNDKSKNGVKICDPKLRYGAVKISSPAKCLVGNYTNIICGEMKKNKCERCNEQYGSPLVYIEGDKPRLIGIASAYKNVCNKEDKKSFGVYTAVSQYLSFIKDAANGEVSCDMVAYELSYTKIDNRESNVTWTQIY